MRQAYLVYRDVNMTEAAKAEFFNRMGRSVAAVQTLVSQLDMAASATSHAARNSYRSMGEAALAYARGEVRAGVTHPPAAATRQDGRPVTSQGSVICAGCIELGTAVAALFALAQTMCTLTQQFLDHVNRLDELGRALGAIDD